jgi:hypothetical protein
MNKNTEINWITRSGSNQYTDKTAQAVLRWVTKEVTRARERGIIVEAEQILNNWNNKFRETKRARKLVATLKTLKRQYKHSQQHRHNHQHENDNTGGKRRWETLTIEETWQKVQKGKKSNSKKPIRSTSAMPTLLSHHSLTRVQLQITLTTMQLHQANHKMINNMKWMY